MINFARILSLPQIVANAEMLKAIQQFLTTATVNPKLQSSELFINLQYEIAGTENRIATERRRYNQAVQKYNQSLKNFPNVLVASFLKLQPKEFFNAKSR